MKPIAWTTARIEYPFGSSKRRSIQETISETRVADYHRLTRLWQKYRGNRMAQQTESAFPWSRASMFALALGDTHEGVTLLAVPYAYGHARRIALCAPTPTMPIRWHRYDDGKRSYRIELETVESYYEIPFPVERGAEEDQWFCARAIALRIAMLRSDTPTRLAPISRYEEHARHQRRELSDAGRLYFSLWSCLFPLTTALDEIRLRWSRLIANDSKAWNAEGVRDGHYFAPTRKSVDQIVDESLHVRPPMLLGTISGVMRADKPHPIIEAIYEFGSYVPFRRSGELRYHSYTGLLKEPSERRGALRGTCNAHGGWRFYAREQVDPIHEQTPTPIPTVGKEYTVALTHVLVTDDPCYRYRVYPNPFVSDNSWLGREIGDESGSFRFMHDLFGCVILRDSPVMPNRASIVRGLLRQLPAPNGYFGARILIVWPRALLRGGAMRYAR